MLRHVEMVIIYSAINFVDDKQRYLTARQNALCSRYFRLFRSSLFTAVLKKHNIIQAPVPANCADGDY